MASNTVEPNNVIYVECMNFKPHDPHTWREGFLWLTKKTCGGVPEWVKEFRIPQSRHRHYFRLLEASNAYLMWRCEKCSTDIVQARFVWVSQTVYARRLDDNPWEI